MPSECHKNKIQKLYIFKCPLRALNRYKILHCPNIYINTVPLVLYQIEPQKLTRKHNFTYMVLLLRNCKTISHLFNTDRLQCSCTLASCQHISMCRPREAQTKNVRETPFLSRKYIWKRFSNHLDVITDM